tara:strand:- start:1806 stop:1949 length:144 start_codon:yes stop_codon:yes gene_type:complete
MVSASSFDVLGAFVNRESLPYEDSSLRPDFEVPGLATLADELARFRS